MRDYAAASATMHRDVGHANHKSLKSKPELFDSQSIHRKDINDNVSSRRGSTMIRLSCHVQHVHTRLDLPCRPANACTTLASLHECIEVHHRPIRSWELVSRFHVEIMVA